MVWGFGALMSFSFVCFVFTDLVMMQGFFWGSFSFSLCEKKKNNTKNPKKQKRGKLCKTQHNPPVDLFCQISRLLLSMKCSDLAVWGTNFCCWLWVYSCLLLFLNSIFLLIIFNFIFAMVWFCMRGQLLPDRWFVYLNRKLSCCLFPFRYVFLGVCLK